MQSKEKSAKRDVPKIPLPAEVVAEMAECSKSYVKRKRRGAVEAKTDTTKRIDMVEVLWSEGSSALLKEISRVVKF